MKPKPIVKAVPRLRVIEGEVAPMKRQRLKLFLYPWVFESMDRYDHSLPTGTTLGKVWRRHECVGMYAEDVNPEYRLIVWFDVELKAGPKPPVYSAPDWSNFGQWQAERAHNRTDGPPIR